MLHIDISHVNDNEIKCELHMLFFKRWIWSLNIFKDTCIIYMYIHFCESEKKQREMFIINNNNYYKKVIIYICQKDNLLWDLNWLSCKYKYCTKKV